MRNSNITAIAALRNLRGKVGNETRQPAKPTLGQKKSLIPVPDHYLIIGPDTDRDSALDNDVNIPATIHR